MRYHDRYCPAHPATAATGAGQVPGRWELVLPRQDGMAPVARRWARALLAGCTRLDDVLLVAGELVLDTLWWPLPAEEFTLTLATRPDGVRLTVRDRGYDAGRGPASGHQDLPQGEAELEAYGWHAVLLTAIADCWGHRRDLDGRETLWADLAW